MSWKTRLRGDIQLTSPETGQQFNVYWSGDERKKDKKLGKFDYPNSNGTDVQDLGISGASYSTLLRFAGPDNDKESTRFWNACNERGPWTIIHPVVGEVTLQLVSVTQPLQPITSGNLTDVQTEWIEPLPEETAVSTAQLSSEVEIAALDANEASANQYGENLTLDTAGEQIANEQAINASVDVITDSTEDIVSQNPEISSEITATLRGIQDTLDQSILDPLSIAGQVQQLSQLPALAVEDIQSRVNAYVTMADGLVNELLGIDPTIEGKNAASAVELALNSALVGLSQTIITGELSTRDEAVALIDTLNGVFTTITNGLDAVQDTFKNNASNRQYYSNSAAYPDLAYLVGETTEYLLKSSLDLRIAKYITLQEPRNPVEITVTEYGELGDNDENLDFFLMTNDLHNNDIRILQPGRVVVVYV